MAIVLKKINLRIRDFRLPVGQVEVLREGEDITLVSYGSTLRLVEAAAQELAQYDIDAEVQIFNRYSLLI